MARRAEWLPIGQWVGGLGPPPWSQTGDDVLTEKLLSDVAAFLVRVAGLDPALLRAYRSHLSIGEVAAEARAVLIATSAEPTSDPSDGTANAIGADASEDKPTHASTGDESASPP